MSFRLRQCRPVRTDLTPAPLSRANACSRRLPTGGGRQVIDIAPADPNIVYVPYYDPGVVYGGWPYADYPPYYFGTPDYIGADLLATGLAFGAR